MKRFFIKIGIALAIVSIILTLAASCKTNQITSYDYDFTVLSENVARTLYTDMIKTPDNYKNKTVHAYGYLSVYTDAETNKTYYACLVPDTRSSSYWTFEFDANKVDGQSGDIVEVAGYFDTYTEQYGDEIITYYTLRSPVFHVEHLTQADYNHTTG